MACKSKSYTALTHFKSVASANFRSLPGPNSRCSPCDLERVETEFQQTTFLKSLLLLLNLSSHHVNIPLTKPSLCQRSGECKLTGENQPKRASSQALG